MKKRGIALIEIIVVLGILCIFFSIGGLGIKFLNNRYKQIEEKFFSYEITDILNYGKCYCVSNNICGNINFVSNKDCIEVYFVADTKVIKVVELKRIFKIKPYGNGEEISRISLSINQLGYVEPATITLINENGKTFKITVQVGGNVILIKEGEN